MAQFSPALIGGLYWRGGSKQGVYAGLLVGFGMWAYTLLLPTVLRSLPAEYSHFTESFQLSGQWALTGYALKPCLVLNPLLHSPMGWYGHWSEYYFIHLISRIFRPSVAEQIQAESFSIMKQATANTEHVNRHQLHSSRCCTFKSW